MTGEVEFCGIKVLSCDTSSVLSAFIPKGMDGMMMDTSKISAIFDLNTKDINGNPRLVKLILPKETLFIKNCKA